MRTFQRYRVLFGVVALLFCVVGRASIYPLPVDGSNIIGQPTSAILKNQQTLQELAKEYEVGYYEVLEANPTINPKYVTAGTKVLMPTQFILPDAPHEGVVVNLAELRLYYYFPDGKQVMTAPVGIGKSGWETPQTVTAIKDKRESPSWVVPESVYQDMLKRGYKIARIWPPGPNNPLGKHAMRLTLQGYDIHGTNRDEGVGRRTSAGCIRMYPEDVATLFSAVNVGTKVTIINQPVKLGKRKDAVYIEAHRPLKEQVDALKSDFTSLLEQEVAKEKIGPHFNLERAKSLVAQHTGIVSLVGCDISCVHE